MAVTITDLEQALINADKAGDVTSARLLAAEISKIQQSQQPQEGGVISGAQKRISQAAEGVKGVGLRLGSALGTVSPDRLAEYERQIGIERSVMSPTYGQTTPTGGAEIAGATGLDVLTSLLGGGLLKAGGFPTAAGMFLPRTVPQAAAGSSLYSLTTPSQTTEEMATKAGVAAPIGGLTQFGLRQVGLAPQVESRLTAQQQEVGRRALEQGFQLDPTQITGIGQGLKEGIKSNVPIARRAFTRFEENNQTQTNNIAKSLIKLDTTENLTNDSMEAAFKSALNNYKVLQKVPAVQGDQKFVTAIDNELSRLNKIPKPQLSTDDKKAIRVLKEYKNFGNQAISGEEAFIRSKAIGNNLFQAQKSGSGEAANAFKTLRSAFEQSIEDYLSSPANLMRTNGKATLDQFKDGRKTLSNWYLIDKAFNPDTGNVSASKLSRELAKKPTYGTTKEPIETAAQLSGAFPRAFPSSGTAERLSYGNIAEAGGLISAPFTYAATSQPVRNILAQKYLGAAPEGILGNIYGGISTAGGYLPQPARNAFGRALMSVEQQQLNQQLAPIIPGLIGQ
jgi:hypothetical protein